MNYTYINRKLIKRAFDWCVVMDIAKEASLSVLMGD
jgi:hypothetical protein